MVPVMPESAMGMSSQWAVKSAQFDAERERGTMLATVMSVGQIMTVA